MPVVWSHRGSGVNSPSTLRAQNFLGPVTLLDNSVLTTLLLRWCANHLPVEDTIHLGGGGGVQLFCTPRASSRRRFLQHCPGTHSALSSVSNKLGDLTRWLHLSRCPLLSCKAMGIWVTSKALFTSAFYLPIVLDFRCSLKHFFFFFFFGVLWIKKQQQTPCVLIDSWNPKMKCLFEK